VDQLLEHGFRPDTASVLLAVRYNHRKLLTKLLNSENHNRRLEGIDTPLQMAVRLNLTGIIHDLLSLGVDVNACPPSVP
jgi:hypothetical protein